MDNKPAWKGNNPTLQVFAAHIIDKEKEEISSTLQNDEETAPSQENEGCLDDQTVPQSDKEQEELSALSSKEYYLEEYEGSDSEEGDRAPDEVADQYENLQSQLTFLRYRFSGEAVRYCKICEELQAWYPVLVEDQYWIEKDMLDTPHVQAMNDQVAASRAF
ncbi:hypothetical protein PAXINDRAFT_6489 [Paxillus involutus ATCC 200175]|nr:hypothetical protein PAXINDRAFT_6489 [Paxillus involutus ATCC 200175]